MAESRSGSLRPSGFGNPTPPSNLATRQPAGGAPPPQARGGGSGQWDDYRNIDMDLHQVLTKAKRSPEVGEPNQEMVDLAKAWLADDPRNRLVVSCGGFREYGQEYQQLVSRWLQQQGIDTRRVTYEYKPKTLAVIDDHGLEYVRGNGPEMLKEVLNRSHNLDAKGPDVLEFSGGPAPDERKTLPPEAKVTYQDVSRGRSVGRQGLSVPFSR